MIYILDASDFTQYPFNYEFQGNEAKRFIENVISFSQYHLYSLLGITLAKDFINQLTPYPPTQISTLPHYIAIHNDIKEFIKRRAFVQSYETTFFYVGNLGASNDFNINKKTSSLERQLHNESNYYGCEVRKYIKDNINQFPSFCDCEWKLFYDFNGLISNCNQKYLCK